MAVGKTLAGGARPIALALVLLAARGPAASPPGPTRVAPIYGADLRSLAILDADPDLVLAGSASGHVYRSTDGGASWRDAGAPLPLPGYVVGTLAFDPHDGRKLWAGLQGIWGSGTVVASTDLGVTWEARGSGLPAEPVYCLAFDPGHAGRLYAGTTSGVYATSDGGKRWTYLSPAHRGVQNVSSLWVDPARPRTLIAGTFRRAYKSDDGGQTWRGVFDGMELDSQVFSLQNVPDAPATLWASTCGWVYRSTTSGETWQRFKDGLRERRTPSFRALPDGRLLAGTTAGLYVSSSGGSAWRPVPGADVVVHAIAIHPRRRDRILIGTEGGGVYRSTDGGATFAPSATGMSNLRIAGVCRFGADLLVAVRDAGPVSGVYRSRDGGASFHLETGNLPPVTALRALPDQVLAATDQGLYVRLGTAWKPVAKASARVHDIALPAGGSDARVVVATASGVLQGRGLDYAKVPPAKGVPLARSAASFGPSLWLSGDRGLWRTIGRVVESVGVPFVGGRLAAAEGQLVYFGEGGAFARRHAAAPWEILTAKAARVLPTQDVDHPFLLVHGEGAELLAASGRRAPIEAGIPARDITAVLVDGSRLWIGSSGYGLLDISSPVVPSMVKTSHVTDRPDLSPTSIGTSHLE